MPLSHIPKERKTSGLDVIITKDIMLVIEIGIKITLYILIRLLKNHITTKKLTYWMSCILESLSLYQSISAMRFHTTIFMIIFCLVYTLENTFMWKFIVFMMKKTTSCISLTGLEAINTWEIITTTIMVNTMETIEMYIKMELEAKQRDILIIAWFQRKFTSTSLSSSHISRSVKLRLMN
jgi:hypothetical protein